MTNLLLLISRVHPGDRHATGKRRVELGSTGHLASKLLESLALGLGDEEGGEATKKHEQGVDLHDMVEPRALVGGGGTAGAERADEDLCDDGADLAGGGGDTVGGGTVAGGEAWVAMLVLLEIGRVVARKTTYIRQGR